VRLRGDVDFRGVLEHRRLVREPREVADPPELALRIGDELLVAQLVVAARPDAPAEPLRRVDLGPPLARELGSRPRVRPGLGDDALRHREEGQRRVAPVAHEVDEERVREEPFEHAQPLHVHRRLVAPARLPVAGRVRLVDGRDRLAEAHPRPQAGTHLVDRDVPLAERRQPAQVVGELVDVDRAAVAVGELRDEVGLVRDRELRVAVEHHPEQRRAGTADAEDEERRRRHRFVTTTAATTRWPAASITST
jgi:hypothetical protein